MHNISLANKWQIPFVGPFSWYNCVLASTATCAACVLWKRQLSPPLTGRTWSRQRWPIESHPWLLCDSGIVMWTSLVTRSEEKFVRTSGEEASSLFLEHFLTDSLSPGMGMRRYAVLGWLAIILQSEGEPVLGWNWSQGKKIQETKEAGSLRTLLSWLITLAILLATKLFSYGS